MKQRLTCNQMIIVLNAFRGTVESMEKMGNHESDVTFLEAQGYIKLRKWQGETKMDTTDMAQTWVRNEVLKGPQ